MYVIAADEMFGKKIHYVSTSLEMAKKLRSLGHIPLVDGIIPGVTGNSKLSIVSNLETIFMITC